MLLVGLAVYALASVGCLLAGSFEHLLAARVLQGIANAAPRVIAIAVVRDVYGGRRMAEVMSFVMLVFIIVPVIAPSVGGAFLLVGSWHLIFAFLAATAFAAIVWLGVRLPETRSAAQIGAMSVGWVARAYATAASNRLTLGYTLATGAVFSALMGYINSAQQVFVDVYGSGGCSRWPSAAWRWRSRPRPSSTGGWSSGWGCGRYPTGRSSASSRRRSCTWRWPSGSGTPPLPVFVLLLAVSLFCFGLMMPNFNAIAMEPMGRIAGTASSFVGAVTTATAAFGGFLIGRAFDGSVIPLLAGFAIGGVLCLALVLVTERGRLFHGVSR